MTREIKFRAWDPDEKKMYYNVAVKNGKHVIPIQKSGNDFWDACFEATDCIIGEYTGLKDKNGKEIWENDIVKSKENHRYIVNYEYGSFGAGYIEHNTIWFNRAISNFPKFHFEVIGNIYQNPELLNGGKNENN